MPLSTGAKLGPYEILAPLGAGGMGEVYRARDGKLGRDVAIKILPAALANDAQYMARFEREAQVLASLNHPNIATVYGIEQGALVMELVEGADLHGPLPLDEAIPIARQIALGLEAAHERGIVHRDLKPANIKVTPAGAVKILDFGLAKAVDAAPAGNATQSPTLSLAMTQAGMILGTAAYMSPEQARGKPVDKRTDIWAFGVVFYEMLTGRQLFGGGETVTDTLASVVKDTPDLSKLPAGTPAHIRALLERCLRKDAATRLRDIGEARIALDSPPAVEAPATPAQAPWRRLPLWTMAIPAAIILALAGALWFARRPPERPLIRLGAELGPDVIRGSGLTAAISPDGTRLVFISGPAERPRLATRLLNESNMSLLAGTDGAAYPFFSPDGLWIGFFADQQLKKIPVQGGAPIPLCPAPTVARGATWGKDGSIIVNLEGTYLSRVPDSGGTPVILYKPEQHGEYTQRWPQILPGAETVLFTAGLAASAGNGYDDGILEALSLKTGAIEVVERGGYFGRYLPSGHLVFVHQGTLFGVPFDLSRLQANGIPVPLVDDVAASPSTGAGQFDFSQNGTLVYVSGKAAPAFTLQLMWMDATGKTEVLSPSIGASVTPSVAPDGKRVAFASARTDIAVYDPQRETAAKLTFSGGQDQYPLWMPDGKHIVFGRNTASGEDGIWWIRADGSGQSEKLFESKESLTPSGLAPGGRLVAFALGSKSVWTLPLDLSDPDHPKPGKAEQLSPQSDSEGDAVFSPDGRWLAYTSFQTAGPQVFVQAFPPKPSGGKWQISTLPGHFPLWSPNGRELFYLGSSNNRIMVADYTVNGDSFVPAKPRQWSPTPVAITGPLRPLAIAPDGKRFIVLRTPGGVPGDDKEPLHVVVLLNFFDELRRRIR
jgi:serine/threonine-protein kinase